MDGWGGEFIFGEINQVNFPFKAFRSVTKRKVGRGERATVDKHTRLCRKNVFMFQSFILLLSA